jgi:hypothetical protein
VGARVTDGLPGWYLRRFAKMSPAEVTWRIAEKARQQSWRRRQVKPGAGRGKRDRAPLLGSPHFEATLPQPATGLISAAEARSVMAAADEVLGGKWEILGVARKDLDAPDWFLDPVTGRRAPQAEYCFSINFKSESVAGNVKQVWEVSRLQHLTVLACAYAVSGCEAYAEAVAAQLESWWDDNPFLSGVHWTSGIELGLRLISWVWIRRLLDGWRGAESLFEGNDGALAQIWWHQTYLSAFRSRGSSANNHVIAEAAGQLVAALAFPWFRESAGWADRSARLLERELARNTFPSGVNREMAFDYHGFVVELALAAMVEAERAGRPFDDASKELTVRMLDVIAACVDVRLGAPRYGDGDDARGFLLGPPVASRWASLLATGAGLFGAPQWWPSAAPDAASCLLVGLAGGKLEPASARPAIRPDSFGDAGLTMLRTPVEDGPEIWCRCDGGPHGFLSIAAHAHADALSVEVRHDGTEVLVDPGTYCYHGEERWRRYFRSTLAHNTIEVGGRDQSTSGGPFLWTRHARTHVLAAGGEVDGGTTAWSAEHDGYRVLDPPVRHRRTVRLVRATRLLEIVDDLKTSGDHPLRIAYHLGPAIDVVLDGGTAHLAWLSGRHTATLRLPDGLTWTLVRGGAEPLLGWYSAAFGKKEPTTALLGEGRCRDNRSMTAALRFHD